MLRSSQKLIIFRNGSRLRGNLNGPLRPVYHRIPTGAGLRALFTGPPGSGYPHIATLEGNSNDGQTGSPSSELERQMVKAATRMETFLSMRTKMPSRTTRHLRSRKSQEEGKHMQWTQSCGKHWRKDLPVLSRFESSPRARPLGWGV